MKFLLNKSLMNMCSSLAVKNSISNTLKEKLVMFSSKFFNHKIRYISSFNQHKCSLQLASNTQLFSSKFNIFRDFVEEIFEMRQVFPPEDHFEWMVYFQKLLNNMIFSNSLCLSSRVTMITGII